MKWPKRTRPTRARGVRMARVLTLEFNEKGGEDARG